MHLKSKQVIMQTKPTQLLPSSVSGHLKNLCLATLVRASPYSSEAAEGKILVLTLSCTTTHTTVWSVYKQGKTKKLHTHYTPGRGPYLTIETLRSHLVFVNKGYWSQGVSM